MLRLLLTAPLLAALSCAHQDPAVEAELGELRAEMRAIRERDSRLETRLERIEAAQALVSLPPHAVSQAAPATAPAKADDAGIPDLTVVKLKPKAEPAPRISTDVPVVEPSPEVLEALAQAAPEASSGAPGPQDSQLEAEYGQALEALRTGNITGAVLQLTEFANDNPHHAKADNALYFVGVGQMGLSDYDEAAHTFERLLKDYPAGDTVMDALLRLAECRVRLNHPKDARALYGEVISHYPGTAAATQAEARLASLP